MKIFKVILLTFIITGLFASKSYTQKNWAQDADNAFKYYQYYEAIGLYKKAYTKIKRNKAERARVVYQVAECYRLSMDTKQAETWYKKAVSIKYPDPLATLHYAEMLKVNEKYDDAVVQYNAYKELVPTDARGAKGAESCTLAQQWKDNPTRYEVENVKQLNTKDMDRAASWYTKNYKSIVFTSSREGSTGKDFDAWTGESFSDLYLTALDKKGSWSPPTSVGENINTAFNEGEACLNDKYGEMYFTRCGVEKKKQLGCQIYVSKKKGNSWDVPEIIVLGPDSFSYGQPSLSEDELTLYFSSNMEGGYGGHDIWMVKRTKKNKPWDKPINLGPNINTDGDEYYPYIREDPTDPNLHVLYFASDGLLGMGGLDIFKVEKSGDSWGKPVNMKYPINSSADDFAIIFEGKQEQGYFSSDRKGGKGSDDIYSFYEPPLVFSLQGTICNDSSLTTPKEVLKGATITLVGSDGTSIICTTDAAGLYKFDKSKFQANTSYELKVEAHNYFGAKGKESTVGLERSKDFIHDFCLIPIPIAPIVLPEILYDFDKWNLLPQYQDSLNGLIQTMQDNPRIVVELGSHTDARGAFEYNDSLSFKRAKSVVDYLISKGIAGDRLQAKGYGKRVPRTLTKDINRDGFVFPKGTILTEDYINQFKDNKDKFEAAHQLNRRTEFRVLRDDYVPRADTANKGISPIIDIKTDSSSIKQENKQQQQPNNNKFVPKGNKDQIDQQQPDDQQNKTSTKQDSTGIKKKPVTKPNTNNKTGNKNK
jgi:peptidoglycan-associated lipoprotein